jgi:hypothetical protein
LPNIDMQVNNRSQTEGARGYKLSFIINTTVGGAMLLLGIIGVVLEILLPVLRGSLAWGFFPAAVICLSVGMAHRRKYLSLTNRSR